ncbi:hypothetical protein NP493_303g03033 [Ridgeia piscesae]|uniref:Uncharacterized protein n=1 Tax=Ridgeia piscesae TaxID=27915 RepID=A0AAD9L6J0_RIDPI|nr:hypothetical protein NP493_303g03033 [Ridgeia piscesae]
MLVTETRRSVRSVHSGPQGSALVVLSLAALGLLSASPVDGQKGAKEHEGYEPAKTASVKIHVRVVLFAEKCRRKASFLSSVRAQRPVRRCNKSSFFPLRSLYLASARCARSQLPMPSRRSVARAEFLFNRATSRPHPHVNQTPRADWFAVEL